MALFGKSTREDINLIPENQQEVRVSKDRKGIIVFVGLVFVFVVLLFVLVFVQKLFAEAQQRKLASERQTQLAVWQKEATAAAEIVATKTKLTKIKTLKDSQPELEAKLASLASSTPTKVKITNLSLDPSGKTQLVGKAINAASAYQFVEVLKSRADLFSEVSLTSVSKKDEGNEVDFTLSVQIN